MSKRLYTHMVNNVVFGATLHDAWAVYKLRNTSYPGLTVDRKIELKDHLEAFAYRVAADFQLLRVSREWSVEQYLAGALRTMEWRLKVRDVDSPWILVTIPNGAHSERVEAFGVVRVPPEVA